MSNPQPFNVILRVRYSECDPQGVVFNARYVEFVDVAMTEYFRVVFGGYERLIEQGIETQVVGLEVGWSSPARADDVIVLEIYSPTLGNTSITYSVKIKNRLDQRLIAEIKITYVAVDAKTFEKKSLPDAARNLLLADSAGKSADLSGVYQH